MRGLIMDCAEFSFRTEDRPPEQTKTYTNTLVVFVCCEQGDKPRFTRDAVKRIIRVNARTRSRPQVALYPFAHLSNSLAPAEQAIKTIHEFQTELEAAGLTVISVDFGQDKDSRFHWTLPGGVSWFEFSA